MNESSADLRSDSDRRSLCNALNYSYTLITRLLVGMRHDDLAIAMLRALSEIGDRCAIVSVLYLNDVWAGARPHASVKSAADECFGHLRERIDRVRNDESLLRASDDPLTSQDVLLRAA